MLRRTLSLVILLLKNCANAVARLVPGGAEVGSGDVVFLWRMLLMVFQSSFGF